MTNAMPELVIFTTDSKIANPVIGHFRMNGKILPLQIAGTSKDMVREKAAAWWEEHGARVQRREEAKPEYTPEQKEAHANRTSGRGQQFVGKVWVCSKNEAKRVTAEEAKELIATKKWKSGRKWK